MQANKTRKPSNALMLRTLKLAEFYKQCDPTFQFNSLNNPRRVLTTNSVPCANEGSDNSEFDFILYVNDVIGDKMDKQYKIVELLGCGTFGQVVKCIHLVSGHKVAVKIIKNKTAYFNQSMMEIKVLNQIYHFQSRMQQQQQESLSQPPKDKRKQGTIDKTHNNIFQTDIFQNSSNILPRQDNSHLQDSLPLPLIQMYDTFIYKKHLCLVFELLSINLYDLIKQNGFKGFNISLVRDFTTQMLDALIILGQAKIVHCDLKPENILLCELTNTKIKVIDFGSACYEQSTMYTYVQSRFYRAPEVILGLDYSSAIDIWSLGCIVAELFLGLPIFPGTSEYNQISRIHQMMGDLPTYMLEVGKKTPEYFNKSVINSTGKVKFTLKSIQEYSIKNQVNEKPSKQYFQQNTLEDILMSYPVFRTMTKAEMDEEYYNRHVLIDFIKNLLQLNPLKRFSPRQAKLHPFITGKPFSVQSDPANNLLVAQSNVAKGLSKTPPPSKPPQTTVGDIKKSKSQGLGKDKFDLLKKFPSSTQVQWKRTKTRQELKSNSELASSNDVPMEDVEKTAIKSAKKPTITTNLNFIQQGPQSAVLPGKFASNFYYPPVPNKKEDDNK